MPFFRNVPTGVFPVVQWAIAKLSQARSKVGAGGSTSYAILFDWLPFPLSSLVVSHLARGSHCMFAVKVTPRGVIALIMFDPIAPHCSGCRKGTQES